MISEIYYYGGHRFIVPELPDTNAVAVLREHAHDLDYCTDCNGVVLFDFRGAFAYGDDADRSNAAALDDLHDVRVTYLHGEKLCALIEFEHNAEELAALHDLLTVHDGFQEYPLLDESDYSARCWRSWRDAIEWAHDHIYDTALHDRGAEWREYFLDAIDENYGYGEPSYCGEEWVLDAAQYASDRMALILA